jgi:dTDP-4-amino-4,6-dideoxygalactose transaminase
VVATPAAPPPGQDHVFHQYVVRAPDRDHLRVRLEAHGIASAIHYPQPIHLSPAFSHLGMRAGSLPTVEKLSQEICSLPLHPGMTVNAIQRVATAVHDFEPEPSGRFRRPSAIPTPTPS